MIDQRKILSTGARACIIASAAVTISVLFSGMRSRGFAQEIFVAHPG